ncbi:MAG: 2OG-Fe(II) oxygenase [Chloroflexota bacterium]|nr:2OG-Fe(II) oxygenase [Chloroflexota bacterium]
MQQPVPRLSRGERAPDFILPSLDGTPTRFYAKAGGTPTVLLFSDANQIDTILCLSEELKNRPAIKMSILAILENNLPSAQSVAAKNKIDFPVFLDTQGTIKTAYRLVDDEKNIIFLLDANLRVLTSILLEDIQLAVKRLISIYTESWSHVEPLEIKTQAPALLLPNVLDPELCLHLIDVWETEGNVETGVELSQENRRQEVIISDSKSRRDHIVTDKKLLRLLSSSIGRRVMPELQRAFAFQATRFEGFKIVCYDAATSGFFSAHRDNLSFSTAHRRFALSLNLNQDYEGGYLRFPEFGPNLYQPEVGEAIVFSCSHLHEVTEMKNGRRFALLSFLFSEAGSQSRSKLKNSPV